MLESMRRGATTPFFKIIIGFFVVALLASFALADYIGVFDQNGNVNATVVKTGDREFKEQEYTNSVYRVASQFQQFYPGGLDTLDKLKESGLPDMVQNSMISGTAYNEEVARLNLAASEEQIKAALVTRDELLDENGQFDRTRLDFEAGSRGLTEQGYLDSIGTELQTGALNGAFNFSGQLIPASLTTPVFARQEERRSFEGVVLPRDQVEEPEPTEAELQAHLSENQDDFQVPELRAASVIFFEPSAYEEEIKAALTDEEIAQEFRAQRLSLRKDETRTIQQTVFQTEEEAKAAAAKLAEGATLEDVASASGVTDLGTVPKRQVDAALGDAAFELEKDSTSAPVQTDFGWHIVRVTEIVEGFEPTLENSRDTIADSLSTNRALERANTLATEADDLVAEGASLEEIADQLELIVISYKPANDRGLGPDRRPVPAMNRDQTFLSTIFSTDAGTTSFLSKREDGVNFVVRTDEVLEPRDQTFEEARRSLEAIVKREQWQAALTARADELIAEHGTVAAIAEATELELITAEDKTRTEIRQEGNGFRYVQDEAFDADQGMVAARPAGRDVLIAAVTDVKAADMTDEALAEAATKISDEFAAAISRDLTTQFRATLSENAGFSVNETAKDRALTGVVQAINRLAAQQGAATSSLGSSQPTVQFGGS